VKTSIIVPLYNQLPFTKGCLESINRTTPDGVEIILINNASTDGTTEYLASLSWITVISNTKNLGFSGACNQGIKAASGEWLVVLNNDVLMATGWLSGLQSAASRWKLDIVTPAIREGEYNYDLELYGCEFTSRLRNVIRRGKANGICFMAHRRVFDKIGIFDENFRIGQYEDKDLFLRAALAGFKLGTVGCAFIHHFGSVTQNAIKCARIDKPYALENKAYFIRKWNLTWWQRALRRNAEKTSNTFHSLRERMLYGHTLLEKCINGRLSYE